MLSPVTVAALDRHFAVELARYPEITSVLLDRLGERSIRLATTQAISQLTRVDRRLRALFWHLAERWGRVSGQGVIVPLALTHRILGQLVGARRPTVSTALAELAERGELVRRPDGSWLLRGDPPDAQSLARRPAPQADLMRPARRFERSDAGRPGSTGLVTAPETERRRLPMTVRSSSEGILADERADAREELIEMLKKAYFMEIETVMSYITNSINPDGVRAQEIIESLKRTSRRSSATRRSSPTASRSSTAPSPARWSSRPSRATCSRPSTRRTSCTSSRA